MDPRITPANDRVALEALRGNVLAPRYVDGRTARIALPLVDLCRTAAGARDRQLLLGDAVTLIEIHEGWAFVQAAKDGYCGYVPEAALGPPSRPTHVVATPATHLYQEPRVQARECASLSFAARLTVIGQTGRFAETTEGFVPETHLRAIDQPFDDAVAVAEMFLGTPYLWGGNSRAGLDCSGLVQIARLACGHECPADSDQQQVLGSEIAPDAALQRGDLVFWTGHVAMVLDDLRFVHATGHAMATVIENIDFAIARIAVAGHSVLARRRP